MRADIAIIGGGLAGSTTAAMLGRAGIDTILIDPHETFPPDFRCEKLDSSQVGILRKTGIADEVLAATTADRTFWTARFGRLIEKRAGDQHGVMYDDLVNAVRSAIPSNVTRAKAMVTHIATSADRQELRLSDDRTVSARLIVVATGLNIGLRHLVGIERKVLSPCHSITIGFDMKPVGRPKFDFDSMSYYAERPSDQTSYLTLFPIGDKTRANLFTYRKPDDPWLREIRNNTVETLHRLMPRLMRLTGPFEVTSQVRARPADLYVSEGHVQPGIVLVGDAFCTTCPAAGHGTSMVFTDVERLCNVHLPRWLSSPGMDTSKIAAFYDDPIKRACDTDSIASAYHFKSISINEGFKWDIQRWARFGVRYATGMIRNLRERGAAGVDHAA